MKSEKENELERTWGQRSANWGVCELGVSANFVNRPVSLMTNSTARLPAIDRKPLY
jgi:hypothetical protein